MGKFAPDFDPFLSSLIILKSILPEHIYFPTSMNRDTSGASKFQSPQTKGIVNLSEIELAVS